MLHGLARLQHLRRCCLHASTGVTLPSSCGLILCLSATGCTVEAVASGRALSCRCFLTPATVLWSTSKAATVCCHWVQVELVEPPAGSKPGERVSVTPLLEDPPQPDEQLNPKKKIFEMVGAL